MALTLALGHGWSIWADHLSSKSRTVASRPSGTNIVYHVPLCTGLYMMDECRELLGFGDWGGDHGFAYNLGPVGNWNDFEDIAGTTMQPPKLEAGPAAARLPVHPTCGNTGCASGLAYAPATPNGRSGPRQVTAVDMHMVPSQLVSRPSLQTSAGISSTASDSALTAHVFGPLAGSNSNMAQSLWLQQDIITTSEDNDWQIPALSLADDELYGCGPVGLLADELAPVARVAVLDDDEEDMSATEPVLSDKQSVGQSTPPRRELRGRKPFPFRV